MGLRKVTLALGRVRWFLQLSKMHLNGREKRRGGGRVRKAVQDGPSGVWGRGADSSAEAEVEGEHGADGGRVRAFTSTRV